MTNVAGPVGELPRCCGLGNGVEGARTVQRQGTPMNLTANTLPATSREIAAEAAGLDDMRPAGTHLVPIDGPRPDLGAATPPGSRRCGKISRRLSCIQVLEQQHHRMSLPWRDDQPPAYPSTSLAGVVAILVAAAHDAQCRRHGALARGQELGQSITLGSSLKT